MKCYVVLPCYNEAENLPKLLMAINDALRGKLQYKVVAVNDGSIDSTGDILKRLSKVYPLRVIEHFRNMGLAKALETGFKAVLEEAQDGDYVIFMDSDNTHNPKYIPYMIDAAKRFDVVIGSRYVDGGRQLNVPVFRVLMSRTVNYLIRLLLKVRVRDCTSGYRCFKASTIKRLHKVFGDKLVESNGFEVSFEIFLKAVTCGTDIGEIPITLDYGFKNGASKLRVLPTILSYLAFILSLKRKLRIFNGRRGFFGI